jgi:hypothetical protein
VATRGAFFETSAYSTVSHLLDSEQMFENLYETFREHEKENPEDADRQEIYRKTLEAKGSLFASHPTIAERLEAVAGFPTANQRDDTPARDLLTDPPAAEKELTEFITAYVHHVRQLQAAAAAAES